MPEELRLLHGDGALDAPVTEEKSFNECFHCPYFRNGCSAADLVATSLDRVIEIFQISRARMGLSYEKLAEEAGMSRNGVMRLLRGEIKDPSFLTIQALARVLWSDPNGKHPCALHLISDEIEAKQKAADAAIEEAERLRSELATIEARHKEARDTDRRSIEYLKTQVAFKEEQMQRKDHQINGLEKQLASSTREASRRDRRKATALVVLSVLLFFAIAAIITALVIDKLNPDIGFFWRNPSAFYDFTRGASATMPPFGLL